MFKYIRAFFVALRYTLRGETMPSSVERQFPTLTAWLQQTEDQLRQVYQTAAAHNLDKSARQQITIDAEGRQLNMETILSGLRFHITEEYPYMLKHLTAHSVTAIYAANMNDQFFVAKLAQADELPAPVQQQIVALKAQLDSIPSSTEAQQSVDNVHAAR